LSSSSPNFPFKPGDCHDILILLLAIRVQKIECKGMSLKMNCQREIKKKQFTLGQQVIQKFLNLNLIWAHKNTDYNLLTDAWLTMHLISFISFAQSFI
jgi:hypothetical protein